VRSSAGRKDEGLGTKDFHWLSNHWLAASQLRLLIKAVGICWKQFISLSNGFARADG